MHEVFRLGPDHSLLTLSYFQHCKPLFHKISNFSFYLQCQYHIYFLWFLNVNFDFHFFHLENTWFVENILQKPRYLFLLLVFIFIILIVLICRYFKLSLLNCHSASRAYVLTCQRALRAYVPTCFACLHAHVPTCIVCSSAQLPMCFAYLCAPGKKLGKGTIYIGIKAIPRLFCSDFSFSLVLIQQH